MSGHKLGLSQVWLISNLLCNKNSQMGADKRPIAAYPALPPNPPLQHLYLPPPNTAPNPTAANRFDRLDTDTKIIRAPRAKEVEKEREYKVRDEEGMAEYEEGEGS